MDKTVEAAKIQKVSKPLLRPISQPVTPQQAKQPEVAPIPRGIAQEVQAPEGSPGVQPTLMERSHGEDLIPTDPWETSPLFYEIAQLFNIEPKFYGAEKDKLSVITDWAVQEAKSNKLEDIYHVINQMQSNLLRFDAYEKPHNLLYRYLRLRSHADAANRAVKAFERGPVTQE